MMNTIAGEGTNSDGREVTMIVQEKERTDAEMTGMKGTGTTEENPQKSQSLCQILWGNCKNYWLNVTCRDLVPSHWFVHVNIPHNMKNIVNNFKLMFLNIKLMVLFITSQGVGQRQRASQPWRIPGLRPRSEREIYPTQAWHEPPPEAHEKRLVRLTTTLLHRHNWCLLLCKTLNLLWQGWPWWRPIPWRIWFGIWWRRRA